MAPVSSSDIIFWSKCCKAKKIDGHCMGHSWSVGTLWVPRRIRSKTKLWYCTGLRMSGCEMLLSPSVG
jgi:hypothetical protein